MIRRSAPAKSPLQARASASTPRPNDRAADVSLTNPESLLSTPDSTQHESAKATLCPAVPGIAWWSGRRTRTEATKKVCKNCPPPITSSGRRFHRCTRPPPAQRPEEGSAPISTCRARWWREQQPHRPPASDEDSCFTSACFARGPCASGGEGELADPPLYSRSSLAFALPPRPPRGRGGGQCPCKKTSCS